MTSVLIIEDQSGLRRTLELVLQKEGFEVASLAGGQELGTTLAGFRPDLVLTDLKMEPVTGLDVLRQVRATAPGTAVILMTAFGTISSAVEAMKLGAADYITKPFRNQDLITKVNLALEKRAAHAAGAAEPAAPPPMPDSMLVAHSARMKALLAQVDRIAHAELTVLITGETGTGKSLIAHTIHRRSSRARGPFITVNAAAVPEPLLESELFGHEKGAFTGATQSRRGLMEEAQGGILFLDEIGALPASLQAKLLGVLQDREVRRVGSNRAQAVDLRVLAATNANLEQAVLRGEFRQDLFYRLNVARLHLPPLREHREDIPHLLKVLIQEFCAGREPCAVAPDALSLLMRYDYPGNVRELRNAIEWAATVARGPLITPADLPDPLRLGSPVPVMEQRRNGTLADLERDQILRTIERVHGNLAEAARALGIGRTTLWRKMREYGIGK
jgi:two-component system, NtrC family, response regulator AtoC